jgi:DNA polymerase-1
LSDSEAIEAVEAGAEPVAGAGAGRHLVLIDGSGFIFRAFHALPPMTRADGTPVNAVFGFCNMLARLMRDHVGTHLAVVFDAGRRTFRNTMYADYKAHRPEPPEELVPQFALIREATAAFGVPAIELADYEADDLIASYAAEMERTGGRCTIVSSDKDLMQVVGGGIEMLDPIKQKAIGPAEIEEKFGVPPHLMVEVQALMGDSVDNVPGVPGIGPKKAAALILEYGTVEAVLAAAEGGSMKASKQRDALVAHAEAARISRRLVELRRDVPLPLPVEQLGAAAPEAGRLGGWLEGMGFRSIRQRLGLDGEAVAPVETPVGPPASVGFGPYACVTDEAALEEWVARAQRTGLVSIGHVTDGRDPMRAALIGLSLATEAGQACYVPLRHESTLEAQIPRQIGTDRALAVLAPLLADPGVLKIFHNAKHAMILLSGAGTIAPVDDVMLISYAAEAGAHGHGLEELSARHLAHTPAGLDAVTGTGRNRLTFDKVPLERAVGFAAEAADVTLRLWHAIRPSLRINRSLVIYEAMERRLVPILAGMERDGIMVDAVELRRLSEDFGKRMAVMETEIHQMAGRPFNLGSPKQLGEVLFDEMSLPGGKRMKTGAWGTDSTILQGLAEQGHALPERILQWRQLDKLKSTYADSLVSDINPATGRVHTNYQMAVTSTGRLSSYDPNLQNIPIRTEEGGRLRRAFVAGPGNVLVSADYSQIELRLLAHVADIPALKESFSRGEDIHARTASEVFGVPMAGMDALTRRRAKAINFGIIYGISAFGLARNLGIDGGTAKQFIEAYFARYPEIRAYMERAREEARLHGHVLTPFGRRCWIPGIAEKNPARRGYAERQAINAPLQGGAADIIKRAMVRLPAALASAGFEARMLLQVHDELLFEAPEAEATRLAETVRGVMAGAAEPELTVPLVVETGIGRSWAEAH